MLRINEICTSVSCTS